MSTSSERSAQSPLEDDASEVSAIPADTAAAWEEAARDSGEERAAARREWMVSFGFALGATLATRLLFFAIAYGAAWLTNDGTGHFDQDALGLWDRWDASHLLDIAENGYGGATTTEQPEAFFPLFPLLVRFVSLVGTSALVSGLVVTTVATVVALAFLHRMAEHEIGAGAGRRAVLYLAFFPTAVFLVAPYTESIFLAGAISAFYLARRRKWLWVGPAAAVAMGSRAIGIFLLAGLAVEFLRQRPLSARKTYEAGVGLALGALPLLTYGAWLRAERGGAFAFFQAQESGWGRAFTNPYDSLLNTWQTWTNPANPTNWFLVWRIEVIAAFLGIAIVVWALGRREWGFAVYMGGGLAALVTSTWFFSIPRMLLTFFPLYLFLANATRRRPLLHEPLLACSAALATLGVVVFTRNMWFF